MMAGNKQPPLAFSWVGNYFFLSHYGTAGTQLTPVARLALLNQFGGQQVRWGLDPTKMVHFPNRICVNIPHRINSCAQLLETNCAISDPLYTLLVQYYNQGDLGWTQSWVENLDRQENCRSRKSQWPDLPQSVSQGLLCGSSVAWDFLPSHFFSTSHCLVLLLHLRKQENKSPCSRPQALSDSVIVPMMDLMLPAIIIPVHLPWSI